MKLISQITFTSSNVGYPDTFRREECGGPTIISSGVDDAVIFMVD
jgi:hypothetical protein